jgi:integrase
MSTELEIIPVLSGEAYENLLGTIKSKETRATYDHRIKAFLAYSKMGNPDQLIQLDTKTAEKKIISYIEYLKAQGKARPSIEGVCAPLSKFYSMNDIVLNWKKIHAHLPEAEKTIEDKAYTHEQIHKMLDSATKLRGKALVLLLASSGMRIGGIPDLRMKHVDYIEKHKLYQITVYPKSTKKKYVTFCTPEAATMLNSYFDFRRNCGENIIKESPVIRDDFDRNDVDKAKNAQPTTVIAIKNILEDIVVNSGLKMGHDNGSQRTEIMRAHAFRKFFDTNLIDAKVEKLKIEVLMGWKSKRGLQLNYDRSDIEELLEAYLRAVNNLTIKDENRLKTKVDDLEAKNKEIETLKSQIAAIQK